MKYLNWIMRILVLSAIVAAVWNWGPGIYRKHFVTEQKAPFVPTGKVRQGVFVISVHELGSLKAERSVSIISEIEGRITKLAQDGTNAKPGDILVELDTTALEQRVREAQLRYENQAAQVVKAQAELDLLKEQNKTDIEQQQAQLDFDKTELQRAVQQKAKKKRLAADKLIPATEAEDAELDVASKQLAVDKGTKQLDLKKKEAESKEAQQNGVKANVEFQAKMMEEDFVRTKRQLGQAILKAPASGLIVVGKTWMGSEGLQKFKVGDMVYPRFRMIELPDLTDMLVVSLVGESDAPRVRVGMPVVIRLDALPDRTFHGEVSDISSLATEPGYHEENPTPGRKNFEVRIKVKESDPARLKPGMTADAEFIIDRIPNAIYVPIEAVIEKEDRTVVYVKRSNRFEPVTVRTGKESDNFIIITRGLAKGEVVALRDPARLYEEQESAPAGKTTNEKPGVAAPVPNSTKR